MKCTGNNSLPPLLRHGCVECDCKQQESQSFPDVLEIWFDVCLQIIYRLWVLSTCVVGVRAVAVGMLILGSPVWSMRTREVKGLEIKSLVVNWRMLIAFLERSMLVYVDV